MKTIWNRTSKPLIISLHGGHILHLNPNRTGQVADRDSLRPSFVRMVVNGEIAILENIESEAGLLPPSTEFRGKRDPRSRGAAMPIGGRTGGGRRESAA